MSAAEFVSLITNMGVGAGSTMVAGADVVGISLLAEDVGEATGGVIGEKKLSPEANRAESIRGMLLLPFPSI